MKTGYSLLLGEYIDSIGIDYSDCKNFQIICPICREPVFKVIRNQPPPALHYLSHYEESKAFASDCELRVRQIGIQDQEKENFLSRAQKLEYFLSVLREEILKNEFGPNKRETIGHLMNVPGVQMLRDGMHAHLRENKSLNDPNSLPMFFDDYLKDIKEVGGSFPETVFGIITQKRIATDIWLHLLSAIVKGNFTVLFCAGMLVFLARIAKALEVRPLYDYEKIFGLALDKLTKVGRQNALSIIDSLKETPIGPPHAMQGSDFLTKLMAEICHEMLGILLRLPYFKMLKQAQEGNHA